MDKKSVCKIGKKVKGRGKKIKSRATIYTPDSFKIDIRSRGVSSLWKASLDSFYACRLSQTSILSFFSHPGKSLTAQLESSLYFASIRLTLKPLLLHDTSATYLVWQTQPSIQWNDILPPPPVMVSPIANCHGAEMLRFCSNNKSMHVTSDADPWVYGEGR